MGMSKDEVEAELAEQTGLSGKQIEKVVDTLASIAYREANEGFALRGFGEFRVVRGKSQFGKNPFTGKPIEFKGPREIQFSPDSIARDAFIGRRGKPAPSASDISSHTPRIAEVQLNADADGWRAATGGDGGDTVSKLGGEADWIQTDETPICCGAPSQFCGQLDLLHLGGPEMLYVFFCSRCHSASSVYQCS